MGGVIDALRRDLAFAARSLRRSRLFTITSILTLALGIAAATIVFSLLDGILIRPLPFADAGRLMSLAQTGGTHVSGVSYPNFQDWQQNLRASPSFASFGYARGRGTSVRTAEGKAPVIVALLSPGFFGVLQEPAMLGRLFTPDEEQTGAHVMVLTWDCWQHQFHGDPGIIGRAVSLESDGAFTVVGILPRGEVYPPFGTSLLLPLNAFRATERALTERALTADSRTIVRLAPGVTAVRAAAELSAVQKRLAASHAEAASWPAVQVRPVREELLGNASSQLTVLAVAVALVLLITWVNVANLSLVRAAARTRELAIRVGLGASRSRIIGHLLTEALLLAFLAAALAVTLVTWSMTTVKNIAAGLLPRVDLIHVNMRAFVVCAALTLLSTVAVGLVPAMSVRSPNLTDALLEESAAAGTSRRQRRIRSWLVSGEFAFALALVIAAGLLIKSFWRLANVSPGFDTQGLVAIDFSPPPLQNADASQAAAYYTQMLTAVKAVPGVSAAALTNHMPLNGAALPVTVQIAGRPVDPEHDPPALFRTISEEYPRAMKIPVRRGRGFTGADMNSGNGVLVNETFVKTFFPGQDPIGKAVLLHKAAQGRPDAGEPLPSLVIGVIGDVRHFGVNTPSVPEIYVPYARNPWGHMVLVARGQGSATALIPRLRRAMLSVDANASLDGGTMGGFAVVEDLRANGLSNSRLNMMLLSGFGGCALLLAALGIYGTMAYLVVQRRRELGIRRALGAQATDVARLVFSSGARLVAVGVAFGLTGALALGRLMNSLLYDVAPTDLLTFATMTGVLLLVAALACSIPAWRASRVDPLVALRSD